VEHGGGYPWTVVPVEKRDAYMEALETASANDTGQNSGAVQYIPHHWQFVERGKAVRCGAWLCVILLLQATS